MILHFADKMKFSILIILPGEIIERVSRYFIHEYLARTLVTLVVRGAPPPFYDYVLVN